MRITTVVFAKVTLSMLQSHKILKMEKTRVISYIAADVKISHCNDYKTKSRGSSSHGSDLFTVTTDEFMCSRHRREMSRSRYNGHQVTGLS